MSRRVWFWVGGLLTLYLGVGLWTAHQPAKPMDLPGSTFAAGPHGTMALEQLWKRIGLPFETWEQIPGFLPAGSRSVFVSVAPDTANYRTQDVNSLLQYAADGHTVIWASDGNDPIYRDLHIDLQQIPTTTVRTVTLSSSTSEGSGADSQVSSVRGKLSDLSFSVQQDFAGSGLQQARQLYKTPDGDVIGAVITHGKGTVVLWSAPGIWENGSIGKQNNLRLAWSLIGNKGVLWDEYGHGYATTSTLGWMFHGNAAVAEVLLSVALLLYLYRNFWRFGPIRNPLDDRPMLGTDLMDSLTWQLRRRRLRDEQFRQLVKVTEYRIARDNHHRGELTTNAAQQRVENSRNQALGTTWQKWREIVKEGYEPRQWREFLKLTKELLQEYGDTGDSASHAEIHSHQSDDHGPK